MMRRCSTVYMKTSIFFLFFFCLNHLISLSSRQNKHDIIIFGQLEPMIDKLPGVNDAVVPLRVYQVRSRLSLSLPLPLCRNCRCPDMVQWCLTEFSVRYADVAPVQLTMRHSFLFPFDRGLCMIPSPLILSSQKDLQFMSLAFVA